MDAILGFVNIKEGDLVIIDDTLKYVQANNLEDGVLICSDFEPYGEEDMVYSYEEIQLWYEKHFHKGWEE